MSANEKQVGGDHYRSSLQHWDIVAQHGIGYLEGNATKYVTRWRKKNGIADLEKAAHYIEKMLELVKSHNYKPAGIVPSHVLERFLEVNEVHKHECVVLRMLFRWESVAMLEFALDGVKFLIENAAEFENEVKIAEQLP